MQQLLAQGVAAAPALCNSRMENGCVERFIRTLKEQLLSVRTFRTVEELWQALGEFRDRFNRCWIVERLGYLTRTFPHDEVAARTPARCD